MLPGFPSTDGLLDAGTATNIAAASTTGQCTLARWRVTISPGECLLSNADERAAAFDKAQPAMLVARQSDARGDLDDRLRAAAALEPQRAIAAQIDARQHAFDSERRAYAAGTARQVAQP